MKTNKDILQIENTLLKLENLHASFDYLRISIASPKRIKSWAERQLPNGEFVGEILKPETINFRTHHPELNGLFCEKIFGPIKNWKCKCGKYNGFILDKVCEECNVEIIDSRVCRYRMGYIELTCPIVHLWYLRGIPNYLLVLLRSFDENLTINNLEQIVYFREGEKIIDPKNPLYRFFYPTNEDTRNQLRNLMLSQENLTKQRKSAKFLKLDRLAILQLETPKLRKRKGAEIIKAALESINLKTVVKDLRNLIDVDSIKNINTNFVPDKSVIRRIRILESFLATKTNPSWMVLTVLPVLPPNLRPLLELESGRLVAADVNEIYRLILTRNQRLFDFLYHFIAPDIITIHGRKLLQEGVDSLIDNARLQKDKQFCLNNKALKSLTEILEGKQGRFRHSLLGKRVDYSARSVIVVGPNLRLNQCGLPYELAVELFQPFLINQLLKTKIKAPNHNTKLAHVIIKKNKPFIWTLLVELTKRHSIILNRAPTLHRLGIQAFEPKIIEGRAIKLHPLVCPSFNADFDGDQMAIHIPLSIEAQTEAYLLMLAPNNLMALTINEPIVLPSQDIVLGCHYLTILNNKADHPNYYFHDFDAVIVALDHNIINLHSIIWVKYSGPIQFDRTSFFIKSYNIENTISIDLYTNYQIRRNNFGEITSNYILTTPGRIILNRLVSNILIN